MGRLSQIRGRARRTLRRLDEPEHPPAPFVVGVPRSGTTLLRLQLDAHPELAIPAETGFGAVVSALGDQRPSRAQVLDALTALPAWPDLALERDTMERALARVEPWDLGGG